MLFSLEIDIAAKLYVAGLVTSTGSTAISKVWTRESSDSPSIWPTYNIGASSSSPSPLTIFNLKSFFLCLT